MAEQIMYQWRDSNNVLHVSQLPPANIDYQTVVLGGKSTTPTATPTTPLLRNNTPEAEKNCSKAQENLRILLQELPVYIDLEDGSKQLLDSVNREQQHQLASKQIALYCQKPTGRSSR